MTGYNIHYSSNGVNDSISGIPSSTTTHDITNFTDCGTYSISVEATSEHLSGESDPLTLCELVSI